MKEQLRKEWMESIVLTENMSVIEANQAMANWWLSKFSSHLETIKGDIANMPEKYSAIDGHKVQRVDDILALDSLKCQLEN